PRLELTGAVGAVAGGGFARVTVGHGSALVSLCRRRFLYSSLPGRSSPTNLEQDRSGLLTFRSDIPHLLNIVEGRRVVAVVNKERLSLPGHSRQVNGGERLAIGKVQDQAALDHPYTTSPNRQHWT